MSYAAETYGVPCDIGRRVTVYGRPGIITADRGHYIGVTFDADKPGTVHNAHPKDGVIYGEMSRIRKPSKGQARYYRYLEYGDGFNSFLEFCRWDADKERSWNK